MDLGFRVRFGLVPCLWLVGNGRMVVMVPIIVPIPPFPTNQRQGSGIELGSGGEVIVTGFGLLAVHALTVLKLSLDSGSQGFLLVGVFEVHVSFLLSWEQTRTEQKDEFQANSLMGVWRLGVFGSESGGQEAGLQGWKGLEFSQVLARFVV